MRRRLLILGVAVATIVSVAVGAVAMGLVGFPGAGGWTRVTVEDDLVAFEMRVPSGTAISSIGVADDAEGCAMVTYRFNDYGLVVEAVSRSCEVRADRAIINGYHGIYRTVADVPHPQDMAIVDTNLGSAETFLQNYAEYTNLTSKWVEAVAIVSLAAPVNPDFPTLVVRSDKAGLDRDEFTEVIRQLRVP